MAPDTWSAEAPSEHPSVAMATRVAGIAIFSLSEEDAKILRRVVCQKRRSTPLGVLERWRGAGALE